MIATMAELAKKSTTLLHRLSFQMDFDEEAQRWFSKLVIVSLISAHHRRQSELAMSLWLIQTLRWIERIEHLQKVSCLLMVSTKFLSQRMALLEP